MQAAWVRFKVQTDQEVYVLNEAALIFISSHQSFEALKTQADKEMGFSSQ